MRDPLVKSVVLSPAVWDVPGPVDVVATVSDDKVKLSRYDPDEIRFAAGDLLGLTLEETRALRHDRDVGWLQA